jgi:hypothetical protein
MCRHCGERKGVRPGGLCFPCFGVLAVRERFRSVSKFSRRGHNAETNAQSRPPATHCPHPPGSEGRLRTLAARAARGESMTHPGDNRGDLS